MTRSLQLLDSAGKVVALAHVEGDGPIYSGDVDLSPMPAGLRCLFEEFETLVNEQVFSRLDSIEDRIAAAGLSAAFEDGRAVPVAELQIFPDSGTITLGLAEASSAPQAHSSRRLA
jgi:hypothetical protein